MAELDPFAFQKGFQNSQALATNARKNRLAEAALAAEERELQQADTLNRLYQTAVKPDGTLDRTALLSGAASQGLGAQIPKLQQTFAQLDKAQREAEKERLAQAKAQVDLIGQVAGAATDPQSYAAGLQALRAAGVDISGIPEQYDPAYVQSARQQALTAAQQLEQHWKKLGYDKEIAQLNETMRHNRATEGLTAQGQQLTNQRALETAQVSRENKATEALDKKVNAFSTQLDKTNIPQFESLLSDIEADISRFAKGDIPGYGPVAGNLPQFMLTREGQMLRQKIAQLQNLTLKDRSGAAVTNQELQRLLNEIGTGVFSTDDQLRSGLANVRRNLDAVKRNVVAGVDENTLREYQARGGLPLVRGEPQKPAAAGASQTRKVVRSGTYNGRKVVQYSDGTVEYQ